LEFAEFGLPIQNVLIEQIDIAFFEEVVVPHHDATFITDDEADLAKVIGFLNVGPDD
jgi:hypothetical protein